MPQGSVNLESPQAIARRLGLVAAEAGRLLAAFADRSAGHRHKPDGSPATEADLASERLILDRLGAAFAGIPVVAEESGAEPHPDGRFFLVDPLDGTRDFLTGSGEYAVCIALVADGRPLASAIAAPEHGQVWVAGEAAETARSDGGSEPAWRPVRTRPLPEAGAVVLVSRRHGDDLTETCLETLPIAARRTCSSAYKFCLLASGEADLYLRCGATMEWDTAAGDHILCRAGGIVIGPDGAHLRYGRPEAHYRNGPFAACGDRSLASRILLPHSCASSERSSGQAASAAS